MDIKKTTLFRAEVIMTAASRITAEFKYVRLVEFYHSNGSICFSGYAIGPRGGYQAMAAVSFDASEWAEINAKLEEARRG